MWLLTGIYNNTACFLARIAYFAHAGLKWPDFFSSFCRTCARPDQHFVATGHCNWHEADLWQCVNSYAHVCVCARLVVGPSPSPSRHNQHHRRSTCGTRLSVHPFSRSPGTDGIMRDGVGRGWTYALSSWSLRDIQHGKPRQIAELAFPVALHVFFFLLFRSLVERVSRTCRAMQLLARLFERWSGRRKSACRSVKDMESTSRVCLVSQVAGRGKRDGYTIRPKSDMEEKKNLKALERSKH